MRSNFDKDISSRNGSLPRRTHAHYHKWALRFRQGHCLKEICSTIWIGIYRHWSYISLLRLFLVPRYDKKCKRNERVTDAFRLGICLGRVACPDSRGEINPRKGIGGPCYCRASI